MESFNSAVDMLEASIQHGTLKGKFKLHGEFIEELSEDKGKYIKISKAINTLKGANSHWSKYFMDKAIDEGIVECIKMYHRERMILVDDVNKLKDEILKIENPVMTEDGRFKFTEIFDTGVTGEDNA